MKSHICSVTYIPESADTRLSLISHENRCVFKKAQAVGEEEREVPAEYLNNFDILLRDVCFDDLNDTGSAEAPALSVAFDDGRKYTLCRGDLPDGDRLFSDIGRYFTAYSEKEIKPFTLTFDSFDGGGAEYFPEVVTPGLITWYRNTVYFNPDHDQMCGSGYEIRFSFFPLRPGNAKVVIRANSPLYPEPDRLLTADIGEELDMTCSVNEKRG
ncbi:MAG: hypothetical protein IKZ47_07065 [Clostridia bacterium]|nr:hypothetical protein [Clostridia bacterium]